MAMGSRGRREAENAIGSCRPFKNSTGSFYGTRGSTRTLGWLESHTEARRIRELLSRAVYVVWSYNTPIAFVSETEDGDRQAYYVDQSHSMTTSHHQSIAQMGLGEYETIGDGHRDRRPRRQPVNRAAVDRANAVVQGYAEAAEREPTAAHVYASLAGSPGYQNGVTEESQEQRMRRLLGPNFADPDWTPWGRHGGLPEGAEERDAARVAAEGPWRP